MTPPSEPPTLETLTGDVAAAVPAVDAAATGRFGDGSRPDRSEGRQLDPLPERLREAGDRYRGVDRGVPYPDGHGRFAPCRPTERRSGRN